MFWFTGWTSQNEVWPCKPRLLIDFSIDTDSCGEFYSSEREKSIPRQELKAHKYLYFE